MQALTGARTALRRAAQAPSTRSAAQRRGLATEEAEVLWADYRTGKVSLQEWVDGNRHKVAAGFIVFYAGIGVWNMRPKKKAAETPATEAPADSAKSA